MGYYEGQRKEPCPRCGGVVATLFISVTPMSYFENCRSCSWPDDSPKTTTSTTCFRYEAKARERELTT